MKCRDKAIYHLIRLSKHGLDTGQLREYSGRRRLSVTGSIIRLKEAGHIEQQRGPAVIEMRDDRGNEFAIHRTYFTAVNR